MTLTGTDPSGNSSSATATVTVLDTIAPTVITQDITVSLDATGNATITTGDIDNGSSDACGVSLALDVTAFTCSDLGANTVTLTATDASGNSSSATATVTVQDVMAPTVATQDLTVYLDGAGNATITAGDVDNGSSDNCSIASYSLSTAAFTCADTGANTVYLTVTDGSGNLDSAAATITVIDSTAPAMNAQDITVYLDAAGAATITTGDVDNGSSDNCSVSLALDVTSFSCAEVGANTVTLTGTDPSGNSSTATATVTVLDTIAPTVITQDITVSLDATGNATITTGDIDNGSSDACGVSLALDVTAFTCSDLGANTVTLTATDASGNSSSATATVTVQDVMAPTVATQDLTVYLDGAGNATITAGDVDNGSSDNCSIASYSLSTAAFTCADTGANTVYLTVTDGSGNLDSAAATITVIDSTAPAMNAQDITVYLDAAGAATITTGDVDNGSSDNCSVSLALDVTSFSCAEVGANTVTLTGTDPSGNSSTATATVTVLDTIAPTVITQDITVSLDATGNATITTGDIDNGSSDACGVSLALDVTAFTCSDLGANTVTLTATDASGNSSSATATVTVQDVMAPTVATQDLTVYLDGAGNATITAGDVDNGSSDNCSIASYSLSTAAFTCADTGANTVYLTVTDGSGNLDSAAATITVIDSTAPAMNAQDITVYLDAAGAATITTGDVDNGSSDNCSVSLALDVTSFSCAEVGANTVTLTGTDPSGNSSSATATVTVLDTIAPTVITQDITVSLDATGNATITTGDIDNGSSDACGISLALDVTAFTCSDLGANTVTLTATDASGNSSSATATVTVQDDASPVLSIQDISVSLDATGAATISTGDIDTGTTDNCSIASLSLSKTAFSCSDIGSEYVTFTATDVNGNSSVDSVIVTIVDDTAPTAIGQDLTVYLDAAGSASITASDVDNGSSDNCSIASTTIDVSTFGCTEAGDNSVVLTITDGVGNTSTATVTVTVLDTLAPTVIAQDITVSLDATGNATISTADIDNGSSDNCTPVLSLDITSFDCNDIGANTVTLTATDASGNSSSVTATVTIVDDLAPVLSLQDISVSLDATGAASISTGDVDTGTTDNCGIASLSLSKTAFSCSDIGSEYVTFTATDVNGNSSVDSVIVTISDDIAPTVVAQNLTVYLDASGSASITASSVDNGSTDNCGIASTTIDVSAFSCTDLGDNSVVLAVTDNVGNSDTAVVTVTVLDTLAPTAIAQDITVSLDSTGVATISASDIDNGSSDNCTPVLSLDVTSFDCSDIGANTVTLTVTDAAGNTATATATVTIEDNTAPTVVVQNISVYLDSAGIASITASDIDGGSSDNCSFSIAADVTSFDCNDTGSNMVVLTATDSSGNSSSATAIVTVIDSIAPTVIGQDVVILLDSTGNASITTSNVNNGSYDNCSISTLTIDQSDFSCTDVGSNFVTLTATDASGNSSSTVVTVIVSETEAPVAVARDITVSLDSSGIAIITAGDIDNGSSDNCSFTTSIDQTTFTCSHVGTNTVTLTVMDGSGNIAQASATVTVVDDMAPVVITQDFTLALDQTQRGSITTSDIDNGTYDNCSFSLSLSQTDFKRQDIGTNMVTLTATDASGNTSSATAIVTVIEAKVPPVFVSTPVTDATEDEVYTYTIVTSDENTDDIVSFTGTVLPEWLTLTENGDDSTATLTGTPGNEHVGDHSVTIDATDLFGNVITQSFTITVVNVNDAPTITSTAVTIAAEDEAYLYNITTEDIDAGDVLAITANTIPAWLTLIDAGDGTASLQGTPTLDDIGDHSVEIQVADLAGATDVQAFTITVRNTNDAPIINAQTFSVSEDDSLGYFIGTVLASDSDGDQLFYTILDGNTDGAFLINTTTGNLLLSDPGALDAIATPQYLLSVRVNDGLLADTAVITINVTESIVNGLPGAASLDISYYPNPTREDVYVRSNQFAGADITMKVYDISGVEVEAAVYRRADDTIMVSMREQSVGEYLMVITVNDQPAVMKIIVQR